MKKMTHRFARTAMMLILAMLTTSMWAQTTLTLSGEGTEENPYLIATVDNWNNLAEYVAEENNCDGLYFKMTNDISTVTLPIGRQTGSANSTRQRFAGIFDGGNHTLTVNINSEDGSGQYANTKKCCAPFAFTQNVTIKNLHVTGTVETTSQFASGLVGQSGPDNQASLGKCTIENCHVSVTFVGNTTGNNTYGNHGTFIAIAEGAATITNSWFDGELTGKNYYYSGGFIGLNKKTATLTNCLFNPSTINITNNNIGGSSEFSHDNGGSSTRTNCYYTKSFSEPEDAQGVRVFETYVSGSTVEQVVAADSKTYYIIIHNVQWTDIIDAIERSQASLTLPNDVIAGTEDVAIVVPSGQTFDLQLNGHTLDRGLDVVSAENDGCVIKVLGELTIGGGIIKGGNNTGNGGAIYNEGTLVISNVTFNSNFADMGGAIYVNGGEVTVNNCTISNNKATTNTGTSGSGIFMNAGTLTLNGGTIKENNSNKNNNSYGVGVYVNGGTFNIQGNVNIKDNKCSKSKTQQNVYLTSNEVMNVTGSINGAYIRVSKENGGVITNGLNGYGNISRFASDNNNYTLLLADNEAKLALCVNLTVNGYGNTNSKWVFIASPVTGEINPHDVINLVPADNYDLYYFDQTQELEWINYKENSANGGGFNLVNGKGYLYAIKNNTTIRFTGTFNTAETQDLELTYDKTNSDENMHGWNLVGNPFPVPATVTGRSYYVMDKDTGLDPNPVSEGTTIPACTGILVRATETNQSVTFSRQAKRSTINNGNLRIVLAQSNTNIQDKAIISFNEGDQLDKYYFGENNISIFIPQDGQKYAIACSEKQGVMPLSYKVTQNGEYTITVSPNQVEMNYLHLIDNMTGIDVDLLATPDYTFYAKTSDYKTRFQLVFGDNSASETENESIFAYINDGDIIITEDSGILQVIDLNGRILVSSDVAHSVSANGLASGVYVLRLINGNDVKTQKLVVK